MMETKLWARWMWLLPAMVIFVVGAITEIDLPGAYMDAVNPDYAVLKLLSRDAGNVYGWFLPGNMLFGRFLVLGGLYHGALPLYVGLPTYAIFGTGIVGIRLSNLFFGLIVLAGAGVFLKSFRVRPVIAAVCLAALAFDPGFIFSFRTQFHITLLPMGFLLGAIGMMQGAEPAESRRRGCALAGLLVGLSCYGYFIYFFLLPVAFIHAVWCTRKYKARGNALAWWCAGLILGVAPYPIGFVLIGVATGGMAEFWTFMSGAMASLDVHSALTISDRIRLAADITRNTVLDVGPATMMLGTPLEPFSAALKLCVLLGVPAVALAISWLRREPNAGLNVTLAFLAGFVLLVLAFGGRLWLHHAALLLPVLYVGLALALDWFGRHLIPAPRALAFLATFPLMFVNAVDGQATFHRLRATGGVALASNALTALGEDAVRSKGESHYFFPDWGVFMSFAMITRGHIPYSAEFTPAAAKRSLCRGRDAVVVVTGNSPATRIGPWSQEVGGEGPVLTSYRQRDGILVLTSARWAASTHKTDCP